MYPPSMTNSLQNKRSEFSSQPVRLLHQIFRADDGDAYVQMSLSLG
jgi:hypothetical protein